jgi:hypothetical protein
MVLNECELQIRAKSLRDRWATNAQILHHHATSDSELNVSESLAMMWEATAYELVVSELCDEFEIESVDKKPRT